MILYSKSVFSLINSWFTNLCIFVHYWKLSLWEKWYFHKRIFWFSDIKTKNEQSEVHITWNKWEGPTIFFKTTTPKHSLITGNYLMETHFSHIDFRLWKFWIIWIVLQKTENVCRSLWQNIIKLVLNLLFIVVTCMHVQITILITLMSFGSHMDAVSYLVFVWSENCKIFLAFF